MSLLSDILLEKNIHPVPKIGRIHRIDDMEESVPDQNHRFLEIMAAVRHGANTLDAINRTLSYPGSRQITLLDCEELAKKGKLVLKRERKNIRVFPCS